MKIRVTLIFLLCNSIAADRKNTIKGQQTFSDSKFPERRAIMPPIIPAHRVYEYSRSMEAINIDLKNENNGSQDQITEPVYYSGSIDAKDLPNGLNGNLGVESGKSLQQLSTLRINSKQPSQIFEVESLPVEAKVLSRKRKDKMGQTVLALLMAYKLKFTALIPILLGGLSLLISTTALAGFFFALFAAVLGLKTH